jgi:hypothetical protein
VRTDSLSPITLPMSCAMLPSARADDREAERPAGQRAALQAPGELQRRSQVAMRGTGGGRDHAGAEVPALEDRVPRSAQRDDQRDGEQ